MSSGKEPGEALAATEPAGELAESDGEGFESWLRQAARAPEVDARVPLPQAGRVIGGKYRIEEQLGRGGMGAVYRATHVVSGKQVALKWMLRPASDERAQQRFTREARAAGRIDHPNVVDVYDIGQDGEASFLVMELLRGEPLRQKLARGPLAPTEGVDLLLPAMRGVAAAHREGVVHRDLKPDNIFLCRAPEGTEREAKVLDFGISSISAPDYDSQTSLTKEGTVLGTPTYMPPEQLESSKDVDGRADVYAFGVILYEALTGRVPFVADSYSALVIAIANTKPRPPRELRPEIPPALEQVVMQAMEKDRATRLASMDALITALLPFASARSGGSGEHVSVEMRSTTRPAAPGARKPVVVAVVVAVAIVAWWFLRGGASPPAETTAAVHETAVTATPVAASPAAVTATPSGSATILAGAEPAAAIPSGALVPVATPPSHVALHVPRSGPKTAAPSQPAAPAPAPPAPKKARSGSIDVDDL